MVSRCHPVAFRFNRDNAPVLCVHVLEIDRSLFYFALHFLSATSVLIGNDVVPFEDFARVSIATCLPICVPGCRDTS